MSVKMKKPLIVKYGYWDEDMLGQFIEDKEKADHAMIYNSNNEQICFFYKDTFHLAEELVKHSNSHDTLKEIVEASERACQKFADKVKSGRALSVETYADCKDILNRISEMGK